MRFSNVRAVSAIAGGMALASATAGMAVASAPQGDSASVPTKNGDVALNAPKITSASSSSDRASVTTVLPDGSDKSRSVSVDLPSGAGFQQGREGGAYVADNSRVLLVSTAPTLTTARNKVVPATWEAAGHTLKIKPSQTLEAADYPAHANLQFGFSTIDKVDHGTDHGQPRYMIHPTGFGRAAPIDLLRTQGWGEARAKGNIPDTGSLYNQFICHPMSVVARAKSSWNIEAWRPDVGLPRTLAAQCNPGGGD